MADPTIEENNLRKIRIQMGLTITALSKMANVSSTVISQTERQLTDPTRVTKNKIVIGLNSGDDYQERHWTYQDVFPNEDL